MRTLAPYLVAALLLFPLVYYAEEASSARAEVKRLASELATVDQHETCFCDTCCAAHYESIRLVNPGIPVDSD